MTNAYSFKIKWPIDGRGIEIRIEPAYYDRLLIYLPNNFLNLKTVYKVLNNPNRIFSGVKRLVSRGDEKYCVVGKPDVWYSKELQLPFPAHLVYVVFLNGRSSIYEFAAEEADVEDPLSPVDWKNRFGELIWKKTS